MVTKFCLQVPDNYRKKYHLEVTCACYTVRQRAPKLSHYYPNTYSRIGYINSNIRSTPIVDGTKTDRWNTPNLGSILPPHYGRCSYATTGCLCHISTKICHKSLHSIKQIIDLCLSCKNSFGLPSTNMP